MFLGAPGWLSQLSIRFLFLARVMIPGSWDQALSWAPRWAWSLLKILPLSFSLSLPLPLSPLHSLSIKENKVKENEMKWNEMKWNEMKWKKMKQNKIELVISVSVFEEQIPSSVIAGSKANSIFNFLRKTHTVFQGGCTNLNSHKQCLSVPVSQHLHQHLLFSWVFYFSHSDM